MRHDTRNLILIAIVAVLALGASIWLWGQVGGVRRLAGMSPPLPRTVTDGATTSAEATAATTLGSKVPPIAPTSAPAQSNASSGGASEPCAGSWIYLPPYSESAGPMSVSVHGGRAYVQWLDYSNLDASYQQQGASRLVAVDDHGTRLTLDCATAYHATAHVTVHYPADPRSDTKESTSHYEVKRLLKGDLSSAAEKAGYPLGD